MEITTIALMASIVLGAIIIVIFFYWIPRMREKSENELKRLEREHWNYVQRKTAKKTELENYYNSELAKIAKAKSKKGENKLDEAVKIITEERRNGISIEDCIRTLHISGFGEQEIEEILEQSDKMM